MDEKIRIGGGQRKLKNRKLHIELIRIIAMFLIIFIHTGTKGYSLYTQAIGKPLYPVYMFICMFSRVAVPLYWMISGALLLGKDESIKDIFKKRILRILIVLVLFSFIYYLYRIYRRGIYESFSLSYFFYRLYDNNFSGSDMFHAALWFLYAYIGMMLILPMLRKVVKVMSKSELKYMYLVCLFFMGILPILERLFTQGTVTLARWIAFPSDKFSFVYNIPYFIGGYYFEEIIKEDELNKKDMVKWIIAGIFTLIVHCLMTQYIYSYSGNLTDTYSAHFTVIIPTFAIYYSIRYLFTKYKPNQIIRKLIITVGSTTFGIMLLEGILRNELVFIYDYLVPYIHSLPACIVWLIVVYIAGSLITLLLKKVPGLRKLI